MNEAIAAERVSLVEQLDHLRDMNRRLKDERDELANYKNSVNFLDSILQQLNQSSASLIAQQATESDNESGEETAKDCDDVTERESEPKRKKQLVIIRERNLGEIKWTKNSYYLDAENLSFKVLFRC